MAEHVGEIGAWMSAAELSTVALQGDLIETDRLNGAFQHWSVCVQGAGCEKAVVVHVIGDVMTGLGALVLRTRETIADVGTVVPVQSQSASRSVPQAQIRVEDLVDAVGEDRCRYNNSIDGRFEPFESTEIVRRGLCKVGQQHDYSAWNNNCEHWASWCRNGHSESLQIEHAKRDFEQWKVEQKDEWQELKSIGVKIRSEIKQQEMTQKGLDEEVRKLVKKIKYKRQKKPPPAPKKDKVVVKLAETTLHAFPMLVRYNDGSASDLGGDSVSIQF